MIPVYETTLGKLYNSNVLDVLGGLEDESIQMCVTSPPYWGLRDYGTEPQIWPCSCEIDHSQGCEHDWIDDFCRKCTAWRGSLGLEPTPELFIEHLTKIFREVRRVLRKDGVLWLNIGDTYAGGGKWSGIRPEHKNCGRALKDTPYAVTTPTGIPEGLKKKDLIGIPWMLAFALRDDGWYLRSDIIWAKPNPMPESVTDRCSKSHEYLFMLTKSAKYYYDNEAIREPNAKATKASKYQELNGMNRDEQYPINPAGRNKRSVWEIATQSVKDAHFAIFPEKLVEPCILAGSSKRACSECGAPWTRIIEKELGDPVESLSISKEEGNPSKGGETYRPVKSIKTVGWEPSCNCSSNDMSLETATGLIEPETDLCVVLDPFFGSGTTGLVCEKLNRKWIGIELNEDYCEIVKKRIEPKDKERNEVISNELIFDNLFE